ncbi:alpha/beta hydrolase [Sphingomonas sp. RS2018]
MPDGVDPAFTTLLAEPRAALRRLPPHVPLAALRHGANAFMASAPGRPIYAVRDLTTPGAAGDIALRLYRPSADGALPVTLFVHGGGFMLGNLDTHDAMCRSLALSSGAAVLAIDYRLSPEAHAPAALDDIAAVHAMVQREGHALSLDAGRIAIVGDSAGGYLAAVSALTLPVRHVGLLYPMIAPAADTPSLRECGSGYMLERSFIDWAWEVYGAPSPLLEADLSRYPPTTIVTAGCDLLRDEGEAFARRLRTAGRDVVVERFAGMIHGFAGLPQLTHRAGDAMAMIAARCGASFPPTAPSNRSC